MKYLSRILFFLSILVSFNLFTHQDGEVVGYSPEQAHAPTPLPDRVVLTWEDDPATTQSVTWRTDTATIKGMAQLAIANANGRALDTTEFKAETTFFKSDINEANYHTVTFKKLEPDTLYAYRVGDGVNWTEYYHFKTASDRPRPLVLSTSVMPRMK